MKHLALAAVAAATLALAACASTPTVHTDTDPGARFGTYRTYAWLKTPDQGSPLQRQRLAAAIDARLGALGWTRVAEPAAADVGIAAHVATEKQADIDTFYSGPAWGAWGWRGPLAASTTSVRTYTVGTLVVDMFDVRTKQAIWRGTASGTMPKSPEKVSAAAQASIDRMFASFPVAAGEPAHTAAH